MMRAGLSGCLVVFGAVACRSGGAPSTTPSGGVATAEPAVAHINEVRFCYNKGLAADPELAGKVVIEFGITKKGEVGGVDVVSSTLKDDAVAKCITGAVKRWKFPKPAGGEVRVEYPFVLAPG